MFWDRAILSSLLRGVRRLFPQFNSFRQFGVARESLSYTGVDHLPLETEPAAVRTLPAQLGAMEPFFAHYLAEQAKESTPFIVSLEKGIATFDGAHMTESAQLILELAHQFGKPHDHHRLFAPTGMRFRPKITQINATVASLAGRSSDNYFHWLWDHLPRLALLQEKPDLYYIDNSKPWQRDLLSRVGLDPSQILSTAEFRAIQAKRLVVPSYPDFCAPLCPWVGRFFRDHFPPKAGVERSGRIYISRRDALWRKVVNEEEVIRFLKPLGFEPVALGELTVGEQIDLFQRAEWIVAPHGAGLANIAFCQPGTRVVEIFAENFLRQDYWRQSELMGLHYTYLRGAPTGLPRHRKGGAYDDLKIDLGLLELVLFDDKVDQLVRDKDHLRHLAREVAGDLGVAPR